MFGRKETKEKGKLNTFLQNVKRGGHYDYPLLFCIILLLIFGVVMVYSASQYSAQTRYLLRQLIFAGGSLVGVLAISRTFDYRKLNNKAVALACVAVGIISVAAVMIYAASINGSNRWFRIGPISIQPSEFCKLFVILYLAYNLSQNSHKMRNLLDSMKAMGLAIPIIAIVVVDDLSTALVICAIVGTMVFMVSDATKQLLILAGSLFAMLCAYLGIMAAGNYRALRIAVWLNPDGAGDAGLQVMQSLFSVATGGFFGKGLGQGMIKLGHLSEPFNDMIFAVICEELGLFGGLAIIILYLVMIWRILRIAINSPDIFGSLICIGTAVHVSVQVLFHIGVCTNFFPNTGMTLPFISYGGSSMMVLALELGLVLAVSRMIGAKGLDAPEGA